MSFWVGTYSDSGGKGLYPLEVDREGRLHVGSPATAIGNASYGTWAQRHRCAYFVDEQDAGRVVAWRFHEKAWREFSASGSGGSAPCYLALDPRGHLLAVANYADGSIALLELDPADGSIRGLAHVRRQPGRGANRERQAGPHAHCVVFADDGRWLYHVDLGLDRIFVYPVQSGHLGDAAVAFEAPGGSGPRHLAFHPDRRHAILLTELSSELFVLKRRGAGFACQHVEPTVLDAAKGENLGGHLAILPSTGLILVTNRGRDNLAAFELENGVLQAVGSVSSAGASPRHFWTDGRTALVANEEAGTIAHVELPGRSEARPTILSVCDIPGASFVFEVT